MGLAASRQEAFWEYCSYGRIHKVKELIVEGIDVNWVSHIHDCCPIHVASQGKLEVVNLLLQAGCNVNARDIRGNLALHHAAMKGHSDIVEKLIQAHSEINAQDKNGWTALHCAAYWCHKEVVKVLLKYGCNIHIANKDERTPLHETTRSPETEEVVLGDIAEILITAGSDINAKSSDLGEADFTPLMFASYHDHPEVAARLITAGCELNSHGTNGWTALHWAADRDNEELVCLLIESGANPSIRALRGETAADRATSDQVRTLLTNAYNIYNELATLDSDPLLKPSPLRRSLRLSASFKRENRISSTDIYKNRSQTSTKSPSSPGDMTLGNFLNGFKIKDPDSADRLQQVTSLVEQVSLAQHPYDSENVIQGGGADLIVQGSDSAEPDLINGESMESDLVNGTAEACLNGESDNIPNGTMDLSMTSDQTSQKAPDMDISRRESCSTTENVDSDSLSDLSDS